MQQDFLLPETYFLLTFTLPDELRKLARSNQKLIHNLLFRSSAEATQQLAEKIRFVGGQIGMIGVLQTWARDLIYHSHVHYLVPGGGMSSDGKEWLSSNEAFLVPVRVLSILFRARFRDALRKTGLFDQVPAEVWNQDWVVHCQPVGDGAAALKYTADEFIRRFLQHVLPKGFVKVRYYGFFSSAKRKTLCLIRRLLDCSTDDTEAEKASWGERKPASEMTCPTCGQVMHLVYTLRPRSRCAPEIMVR